MSAYTTTERLTLTAEDLLAGTAAIYDLVIPPNLLHPGEESGSAPELVVRVRPLTLGTFLLIVKAAKDDSSLIPLLMIQESLVEPKVSLGQVRQMNLGLIVYLIGCIRQISGLVEKKS